MVKSAGFLRVSLYFDADSV
jgi:hypothetical protein